MIESWIRILDYGTSLARLSESQEIELALSVSGSWLLSCDDSNTELSEGEIAWCGAGFNHSWILKNVTTNEPQLLLLRFNAKILDNSLLTVPDCEELDILVKQSHRGVVLKDNCLVERVLPIVSQLSTVQGLKRVTKLFEVLSELSSVSKRTFASALVTKDSVERNDSIDYVNRYMKHEFRERITLSKLAQLVGLTAASFSRFYKQQTGRTPFEELIHVRISYACKLLRHTHRNVVEIAYECGYGQTCLFYKHFSRVMKCTPIQYRKKYLET